MLAYKYIGKRVPKSRSAVNFHFHSNRCAGHGQRQPTEEQDLHSHTDTYAQWHDKQHACRFRGTHRHTLRASGVRVDENERRAPRCTYV